jgi:hypothetical protein
MVTEGGERPPQPTWVWLFAGFLVGFGAAPVGVELSLRTDAPPLGAILLVGLLASAGVVVRGRLRGESLAFCVAGLVVADGGWLAWHVVISG